MKRNIVQLHIVVADAGLVNCTRWENRDVRSLSDKAMSDRLLGRRFSLFWREHFAYCGFNDRVSDGERVGLPASMMPAGQARGARLVARGKSLVDGRL